MWKGDLHLKVLIVKMVVLFFSLQQTVLQQSTVVSSNYIHTTKAMILEVLQQQMVTI